MSPKDYHFSITSSVSFGWRRGSLSSWSRNRVHRHCLWSLGHRGGSGGRRPNASVARLVRMTEDRRTLLNIKRCSNIEPSRVPRKSHYFRASFSRKVQGRVAPSYLSSWCPISREGIMCNGRTKRQKFTLWKAVVSAKKIWIKD